MKNGRWQKMKWDNNGNPYVTHYGVKLMLDYFYVCSDGKCFYPTSAFGGYTLELDKYGDNARVVYSY